MEHHLWRTIIFLWLSTIDLLHTTPNTLDISDYTFHYTAYHYTLSAESNTIYNAPLHLNITLDFSPSTIALLINHHTLDLLDHAHLHEISTISTLNTYSSTKRALQDYYDEGIPKIREGIKPGKPFRAANRYCKATRRGHLATVHSEMENQEITDMCGQLGFKNWHCWLGLRRPFTTWIDQTAVDFDNWIPGDPNNWHGKEDCVEIYTDDNEKWGMWNDLQCSMYRSFICEKEEVPGEDEDALKYEPGCTDCLVMPDDRRRLLNCPNCGGGGGAYGGGRGYGGGPRVRRRWHRRTTSSERFRRKEIKESQEHWAKEHQRARERMQLKEDKARIRRDARAKERRHRAAMRAHLRELRRKHREEIMKDYKREQHFEKRRDAGFRLLDKLIGSTLGFSHGSGLRRRRIMGSNRSVAVRPGVEMMSRCKVMCNVDGVCYEICVNYNVADEFMSVDIRYVTEMVRKGEGNRIDFRRDNARKEEEEEDRLEDAIESYLGYVVYKYESMDWHRFKSNDGGNDKYAYGEYKELNDYMHYFDVLEVYFNNNNNDESVTYVECSKDVMYLAFRMCMKQIRDREGTKETILYFERNGEAKQLNDVLDHDIFHYNNDAMWDEIRTIHVGDDMQWIKKCSFKLLVAQICMEQFDVDDTRASIKFLSKQTYNLLP